MKKILNALLTIVLALTVSIIFQKASKAQDASFLNIIPFVNNVGYIGFFDQNTGMVYLYDSNLTKCIMNAQLVELGKPATTLTPFTPPFKKDLGY